MYFYVCVILGRFFGEAVGVFTCARMFGTTYRRKARARSSRATGGSLVTWACDWTASAWVDPWHRGKEELDARPA
jgi:hypothetical protein